MSKLLSLPYDVIDHMTEFLDKGHVSMLIFINSDFYFLVKDKIRRYDHSCLYNVNIIDFFNLDIKNLDLDKLTYNNQTECINFLYKKNKDAFNKCDYFCKLNCIINNNYKCFKLFRDDYKIKEKLDWNIEYLNKYSKNERCKIYLHYIRKGYLEAIKYLDSINYLYYKNACAISAYYDQLDCLKYFKQKGYICNIKAKNFAARQGNIKCLEYIIGGNSELINDKQVLYMLGAGYLDCLKYFVKDRRYSHLGLCRTAIFFRRLDCLKYLLSLGYDLKIVNFRYSYGISVDIFYTSMDIIKYLVENNYTIPSGVCNLAIFNAKLELLKYLVEHGYRPDKNNYYYGLSKVHIPCLEYLAEMKIDFYDENPNDIIKKIVSTPELMRH